MTSKAKWIVTAFMGVRFQPSTVLFDLSDDQVRRRRAHLRDLGGGRWEVVSPVSFKRGETVGVVGDVPKALMTEVEPVDAKPTPKRKPKRKPAPDLPAAAPPAD